MFLPKVNVNRSFGKGERELGPQGQSETESKSEMQAEVFAEETNAMSKLQEQRQIKAKSKDWAVKSQS